MIQVKGQFCLSLTIADKKDFVTIQDFIEFSITEYAGGLLPTYSLAFVSADESILAYLHEGQHIKIQYGKDVDSLQESVLYVGELNTPKEGDYKRMYELSGFAISLSYVSNCHTAISSSKSGIELALEIAKRNFTKVDSNITKSKDKQNWIQWGITDRSFLSHLVIRSDLMPSFPAMAIKADGTFILKDILLDIKNTKEPKYRFVRNDDPKYINYTNDTIVSSRPLYFNNWTGYQKEKKVLNFSNGQVESVSTSFSPIIALANSIDKDPSVANRFNGFELLNENVHSNFWKAYDHNLVHLTQMSKVELIVSFFSQFSKISPLDIVFLSESSTENKNNASEYNSGLYYVTRVTKSLQSKEVVTTVTLNREAINGTKNRS